MPNESSVDHVIRLKGVVGDPSDISNGSNAGNQSKKDSKSLAGSLKRLVGIDLGLGALLKQSQIFTGYMGNLFSIVGAIIDTVLAPLAPVAFKALAALGKKIPVIAAMAEKHIPKVVTWVQKTSISIDTFLKKWVDVKWAKYLGLAIVGLTAINMSVKALMLTGRVAGSVTGVRGGYGIAKSVYGRVGGRAAAPILGSAGAAIAAGGAGVISSGAVDKFGNRMDPSGASSGANMSAGKSVGRFAKVGRVGAKYATGRIPIIGAVIAGGASYAGGRSQGMSQGKSIARGGFTAGGALAGAGSGAMLGAALGSVVPVLGTAIGAALGGIVGGIVGGYGGEKIFDSLFNKKNGGGGGGGSSNMGVGSGIGLSGYSVPTFVAASAEAFSKTVLESKTILDDYAVSQAALKLSTGDLGDGFNYAKDSVNTLGDDLLTFGKTLRDYRVGVVNEQLANSTGSLGEKWDGGVILPKSALADSGGLGQVDDGGLGGGTAVGQSLFPTNAPSYDWAAQRAKSKELERQENARIESEKNMAFDAAEIKRMEKAALAGMAKPPGYDANTALNNNNGAGSLGDTSYLMGARIAATGGLGQQDDGSGGYSSTDHIVINVYNASGNQVQTSTAQKVGSAWAGTYGGEQEWM
jgi:hypothetical protein